MASGVSGGITRPMERMFEVDVPDIMDVLDPSFMSDNTHRDGVLAHLRRHILVHLKTQDSSGTALLLQTLTLGSLALGKYSGRETSRTWWSRGLLSAGGHRNKNFPSPNHCSHLMPLLACRLSVARHVTTMPGHQEKPLIFPHTSSPIPKPLLSWMEEADGLYSPFFITEHHENKFNRSKHMGDQTRSDTLYKCTRRRGKHAIYSEPAYTNSASAKHALPSEKLT
ncbi:hypothetical protein EYF80_002119 [Liparis tanakae]|uniref:Uncharacterized protein n=1 Tax=Liparis tanakae TaxID=230148 RepID=A0A4Z2JES8_9TELE|nr:hypothetical protein EYF80_002119 [Liparis tanakae]